MAEDETEMAPYIGLGLLLAPTHNSEPDSKDKQLKKGCIPSESVSISLLLGSFMRYPLAYWLTHDNLSALKSTAAGNFAGN